MKVLKKILIGLVVLVAVLVIVGFFLPRKVHVERSMDMKAGTATVYEQINTLKNWEKWSPWHSIDPKMELTYEGPASGKDASYSWKSDKKEVGHGKMTIMDAQADSLVKTELRFADMAPSNVDFRIQKTESGSKVIWTMNQDMGMNIGGRYFGLMMDGMLGPTFEKGLKKLDSVTSAMPAAKADPNADMKVEEVNTPAQQLMSEEAKCKTSEIGKKLGPMYGDIQAAAGKSGVKINGPAFAIYHKYSPEEVEIEAGLPVDKAGKAAGKVKAWEMKPGKALKAVYHGDYNKIESAHNMINEYAKTNKKEMAGAPWEVYITDPMNEKDTAKWVTEIYYPIK